MKGILMQDENESYSGITELADAEQGLLNYYSNIVRLIVSSELENKAKLDNLRILEFGAGTGFLSELIQDKHGVRVDCLEIDETLIHILRDKGFTTFSDLDSLNEKYDLVFSSNVLEHIDDDAQVLVNLKKNLKSNGVLVTYVPAFPILFSDLDRTVGHYRRYTRKELKSKLLQAGYEIDKIQYVDSLGFPASLLLRFIGYKSRGNIGGLASLRIYDSLIFPMSRFLDALGFKYVIGKNLIVHARLRK
jgi:SAM-dependent methyltransferase